MARTKSNGKCSLCGGNFSKAAMGKHLKSCRQKEDTPKAQKGFHLVVEGRHSPGYWMHLEVPAKTTLEEIDHFLRDIWLECCGHLSAFTIEGKEYSFSPMGIEEGIDVAIGKLLSPGMKFYHEYDFGTTTELTLRVLSEEKVKAGDEPIRLLARNDSPKIACDECEKAATQVCVECMWEGGGWLCDECAQEHECGEEMLLPVVNSPRVGMCGYTG